MVKRDVQLRFLWPFLLLINKIGIRNGNEIWLDWNAFCLVELNFEIREDLTLERSGFEQANCDYVVENLDNKYTIVHWYTIDLIKPTT